MKVDARIIKEEHDLFDKKQKIKNLKARFLSLKEKIIDEIEAIEDVVIEQYDNAINSEQTYQRFQDQIIEKSREKDE